MCDHLNSKIKIINKNNFIHSEIFSDINFYSFEIIFECKKEKKKNVDTCQYSLKG